jgi:hypothetical protein
MQSNHQRRMAMAKIVELYRDAPLEGRWNPVAQATIPPAWVAVLEDGTEIVVASGYDTERVARCAAEAAIA